ncbi:unnamed protein product, partial [Prorocentrum cordatum]
LTLARRRRQRYQSDQAVPRRRNRKEEEEGEEAEEQRKRELPLPRVVASACPAGGRCPAEVGPWRTAAENSYRAAAALGAAGVGARARQAPAATAPRRAASDAARAAHGLGRPRPSGRGEPSIESTNR